ncbi:hypothetical protein [Bacillus sp. P14.5]|uniref:hypothetical protein n=1 Tax=Bacillus sp. P14.5 TaxID=1983400 RepID=UPI000DEBC8A8|nr:hypothetical protein [Bacillus sp. P14.5]
MNFTTLKSGIVSLIAAILLFASLFVYEPYFITRVVALLAAIGDIIINLYRGSITKNVFYWSSGLIIISMAIGVFLEEGAYTNSYEMFLPLLFIFTILLATYRDIFKETNNEG